MRLRVGAILCFLLAVLGISAQADGPSHSDGNGGHDVHIEAERLPDMNMPRSGHVLFWVNNEIVAVGGHTKGFVPTATAEYFSGHRWHLMNTDYVHDDGFSVMLPSGKVLIGGGHNEPLGIGQSFSVESYDPAAHSFEGFGCLDRKRAIAAALAIDSVKVMVAGNWYADDGIELFDARSGKSERMDKPLQQRSFPFIFRLADGDAMVVSGYDNRGVRLDTVMADRLLGASFRVPLLETWHPLSVPRFRADLSFIGDEKKGAYAYLMPVQDGHGQVALMELRDTVFSLLPTEGKVPMTVQHTDGAQQRVESKIVYGSQVLIDRNLNRGYLVGFDAEYLQGKNENSRLYVLVIDYTAQPATLMLRYTEPLRDLGDGSILLTPQGNLVVAGGIRQSNYAPTKAVYLLHLGNAEEMASASRWWLWLIVAMLVGAVAGMVWRRVRQVQPPVVPEADRGERAPETASLQDVDETADEAEQRASSPAGRDAEAEVLLMQRISRLMESEQLYLNKSLKLSDLSLQLGVNKNYVSACINNQRGCSFSHFVNTCRVEHAQKLLREHPDIGLSTLADQSGFSSETSFFRAFKAITGKTPREWYGIVHEDDPQTK